MFVNDYQIIETWFGYDVFLGDGYIASFESLEDAVKYCKGSQND